MESYTKNTKNIQVLTPNGFCDFEGITLNYKNTITFTLENNEETEVSENHPFSIGDDIYNSSNLKIGDKLYHKIDGLQIITNIEKSKIKQPVSDLTNVKNDKSHFWCNNILSHNCFFGSAYTLIGGDVIKSYKEYVAEKKLKYKDPYIPDDFKEYNFLNFDIFKTKIWEQPLPNRVYVIGADVGEGIGSDYSVALVIDITETKNIRIVASYSNNKIPTPEYAYLLAKLASTYNNAYISCECNSIGDGVLKNVLNIYQYENIITSQQKDRTRIGIYSHNSIKSKACVWLKDLMNNEDINITIEDPNVVYEMEWFERKMPSKQMIFQAVGTKHDDYIMALIWGLYVLHPDIIEDYYNVVSHATNKYGLPYVNKISSYSSSYYNEDNENDTFKVDIDKIFNNISVGNTETLGTIENKLINDNSFDENTPTTLILSNMDDNSYTNMNTQSNPDELFM